jgi:hypothetical protein
MYAAVGVLRRIVIPWAPGVRREATTA